MYGPPSINDPMKGSFNTWGGNTATPMSFKKLLIRLPQIRPKGQIPIQPEDVLYVNPVLDTVVISNRVDRPTAVIFTDRYPCHHSSFLTGL